MKSSVTRMDLADSAKGGWVVVIIVVLQNTFLMIV
jgi:hypothetical protein